MLRETGSAFQPPPEVRYPARDEGVAALPARAEAQQRSSSQFEGDHDFRFTDRLKESGMTFVHHIVDDAGLNYKSVHYDHGNGLVAKYTEGKSGYLSQSALPLYFGLGAATKLERIDITWPSGRRQALTAISGTNTVILVQEPK